MTGPSQVKIPAGTVLEFPPGTWKHGEGVLRIRVARVVDELTQFYTDEVWIEGNRLDAGPMSGQWIQVLVRIDALTRYTSSPDVAGTGNHSTTAE